MAKRTTTRRKRSPAFFSQWYGNKLASVLASHSHLAGLDQCFVLLVCGVGKTFEYSLIIPPNWAADDVVEILKSLLADLDNWGQSTFPYSANVHEFSKKFFNWALGQAETLAGGEQVALLVAHPEGASTLAYNGKVMREQLLKTLVELCETYGGRLTVPESCSQAMPGLSA